jgi:hypothetical protein
MSISATNKYVAGFDRFPYASNHTPGIGTQPFGDEIPNRLSQDGFCCIGALLKVAGRLHQPAHSLR